MNTLTAYSVETNSVQFKLGSDIRHLLTRTLLAPTLDWEKYAGKTRKQIVDLLLSYEPEVQCQPIKDYEGIRALHPDTKISIGKTWIYDVNYDPLINEKRKNSLINWVIGLLYKNSDQNLMPKMFLFWVDFFDLQLRKIPFAPKAFKHFDIIRNHSLGNFSDLLTEIIADPGMIYYCRKLVPGEKKIGEYVARLVIGRLSGHPSEFLQSISKEKIRRLSRVINKWNSICDNADLHYPNLKPLDIYKEENKRYYEAYFNRSEPMQIYTELNHQIKAILDLETALHLTNLLVKRFVCKDSNELLRKEFIEPVARSFVENGFDISSWLKEFFSHDFFYNQHFRNVLEKQPVDLVFRLSKHFELVKFSMIEFENYQYWDRLRNTLLELGQDILQASPTPNFNSGFSNSKEYLSGNLFERRLVWIKKIFERDHSTPNGIINFHVGDILEKSRTLNSPSEIVDNILTSLFSQPINNESKEKIINKVFYETRRDEYDLPWSGYEGNGLEQLSINDDKEFRKRIKGLVQCLLSQPELQFH